jgi:hypothetical protein
VPTRSDCAIEDSPDRRGLTAAAWVVGFGLCCLPVFLGLLNHDVAWMLLAAERALDGQRLYVDVIEVNPPLIIWLSFAPVLSARILVISPILSFRLIVLGVLAGSVLLSSRVLAREDPERPRALRPVLILAIMALIPLVGYDFGQREHLMLGLFLPYLLLASSRADRRPVGPAIPWIVGLAAGIGIAIKPQFLPLWIAIEASLAWERRDRLAWLRPEALAVAAVGVAYGVAVVGLTPDYLSMARWALPLYARCLPAPFSVMLAEPATMIIAVASIGFLALRPRGEHRQVCRFLLVAGLSLLAIAFLQDKGFTYHFYPAMATGTMLIGLLALGRPDPENAVRRYSLLMIRGVLALLVFEVSAARVVDSMRWGGNPGQSDTTNGRLIRLARDNAPSGSVFTFSPAVAASFPMVSYGEVRWASRYPCLFFLPSFHPDGLPPGRATAERSSLAMGLTERSLLATVVDDLIKERPTLLIVDKTRSKPAFHGGQFDFLDYYSADPRFAEFLRDYEWITEVDQFGVYRRKGPTIARLLR